MGVHGTFCQLCGLPTQHDHYVPTAGGMLKIYRGSSKNGGHRWENDERPFPFGPGHAWLKDAVVLPWDDDRVLRGPIEDGSIEPPGGGSVMVFEGGEDGLAFHHACWELQGSPGSTGPAVRGNGTHGFALVESYQEQLFDFEGLAADGKTWMLSDPRSDARSRGRIESILAIARHEVTDAAKNVEEIVALDRDWTCATLRDDEGGRKAIVRARMYAIETANKRGYGDLARVTQRYDGATLPGADRTVALESFEIAFKAAVENEAQAVFAVVGIGRGRAEYLAYARDGLQTAAIIKATPGADSATVELSDDPAWAEAVKLIQSLR